jgi:hypothetical protein
MQQRFWTQRARGLRRIEARVSGMLHTMYDGGLAVVAITIGELSS